ncbi:MAG: Fur family transcriptional regulator [Kosmotogaceae bacterium]
MNLSNEKIRSLFKEKGIRLSFHKILIYDYLIKNQNHPTVSQIFNDLNDKIPTLSKTTVYNALSSFIKFGLVNKLTIEENETRYDIITKSHGHFKCVECEEITDFDINIDDSLEKSLKDFEITETEIYLKGICPKCLSVKERIRRF